MIWNIHVTIHVGTLSIAYCVFSLSFLILIKYYGTCTIHVITSYHLIYSLTCVIFVNLCLHLWIKYFGQYIRLVSI